MFWGGALQVVSLRPREFSNMSVFNLWFLKVAQVLGACFLL